MTNTTTPKVQALRDPLAKRGSRSGAYLGFAGYATLLAGIKTATTAAALAEASGVYVHTTRKLLKQFHAMRLVHRVGWVRPSVRGVDQPVYLIGDGQDVPARLTAAGTPMPHADARPKLQRNLVAFASVVHALADPLTEPELERESGLTTARLRELVIHLRSPEVRLVHIVGWKPRSHRGGTRARIYQYAPDTPDARRPKPGNTQRERDRARRAMHKPRWAQLVTQLRDPVTPMSIKPAPERREGRGA